MKRFLKFVEIQTKITSLFAFMNTLAFMIYQKQPINVPLMVIFFVPFTCIWAGGSMMGIYGSQLIPWHCFPVFFVCFYYYHAFFKHCPGTVSGLSHRHCGSTPWRILFFAGHLLHLRADSHFPHSNGRIVLRNCIWYVHSVFDALHQ